MMDMKRIVAGMQPGLTRWRQRRHGYSVKVRYGPSPFLLAVLKNDRPTDAHP